jgi:hypothetical protein
MMASDAKTKDICCYQVPTAKLNEMNLVAFVAERAYGFQARGNEKIEWVERFWFWWVWVALFRGWI